MIKIINESKKLNPFKKSTNTSYYDDLMDDGPLNGKSDYSTKDYFKFEKGVESYIEYMTADQYINTCSQKVFRGRDAALGLSQKSINDYAKAMIDGDKFPLPYINLGNYPSQEGRHRMLAAAKAFGKDTEFPVLIVVNSNPSDDEIMEYAKKKFPNDPKWGFDYIKSNFSEEVDEEPELDPMITDAIFIDKGDICDFGEGILGKVDSVEPGHHSDLIITYTELDTGDSVEYELDDEDKVTLYPKDRNPHLYK